MIWRRVSAEIYLFWPGLRHNDRFCYLAVSINSASAKLTAGGMRFRDIHRLQDLFGRTKKSGRLLTMKKDIQMKRAGESHACRLAKSLEEASRPRK